MVQIHLSKYESINADIIDSVIVLIVLTLGYMIMIDDRLSERRNVTIWKCLMFSLRM